MYPKNDYRDYIEHSMKGQTWKKHKYLYKDQWGRYIYPEDRQESISNKKKRSPSGLLRDVYGQDRNGSRLLRGIDVSKLKFKRSSGTPKNLNYGNAKKNSSLFKDYNRGNGSSLLREVDTSKLKFKRSSGTPKNLNYGNAKRNSSLFKEYSSGNGSSLLRGIDTSKLKFKRSSGTPKNLNYGNARKNSSLFRDYSGNSGNGSGLVQRSNKKKSSGILKKFKRKLYRARGRRTSRYKR